jgi:hypothetical protein
MDKKFLISGLVTGVAGFFIGWLIWGILLMKFSEANTTFYPGLMKDDMNLFVVFISTLVWGFFITWVYVNFTGKKSWKGGALTGLIIGLLVAASMDLGFLAFWNLYSPAMLFVDTLANGVYSAILGAIAGLILRSKG